MITPVQAKNEPFSNTMSAYQDMSFKLQSEIMQRERLEKQIEALKNEIKELKDENKSLRRIHEHKVR
jgi:hypothetical protein